MIYKAQVRVRTPGKRWAHDMQAKRDELAKAIEISEPEGHSERIDLIDARLSCVRRGPHGIAIRSLDNKLVDDGSGLEYEFVTYDLSRGKVIIAVFIGDGDIGSPIRFAELFPHMRHGEAYENDRAFLVVSPAKGYTKGWALQPTGRDRHNDYGFDAAPSYLQKLLRAAR